MWQKLRRPLSLLLQLLLLALILFALARPEFGAWFSGGGATVVVLDATARSQARDEAGKPRFETLRAQAAALGRRAGPRRPVALVAVTTAPRVLAPLGGDDAALLSALAPLEVADAAPALDDALALAGELLAARTGARRIVLLSDAPPPRVSLPPGVTLEWSGLPSSPRDNVAITRLATRPLLQSAQDSELLVEVANFSVQRRVGAVELLLDGRVFDLRPYDLAPGERRAEGLRAPTSAGRPANARGWITARLVPADPAQPDALALDDVAYAILPRGEPKRVLLVTTGNPFLERCLNSDEGVRLDVLAPDAFQPAMAPGFDAVILDRPAGPGFDQLATLPAGNFLFLGNSPLGENAGQLDRPQVTEADTADPLLRSADLREISILRAAKLPFDPRRGPQRLGSWRVHAPLRAGSDALLLAGEREPGVGQLGRPQRWIALAFGVADSDLPLRVAFPLFVSNAIRWLAADETRPPAALRAGETLRLAAGERLWTAPQRDPAAILPEAPPPTEEITGDAAWTLSRNGFLLRRDAAGRGEWIAVNTFAAEASDLRPAAAAEPAPVASAPTVATADVSASFLRAWPPWVWLAVGALLLSLGEWGLYHRRRTE